MHFYCYSSPDESTISTSLEEPYHLVMKAYRPLLEALGSVEIVPALDGSFTEQYRQRQSQGTPCYVLAFAPPHKIPRDLPYRIIPVFAWDYSTLPNAAVLGNEEDCWVSALAHFGAAICHSTFARDVVLHDVGPQVAIESIPAPLWDSCGAGRANIASRGAEKETTLSLSTMVIDTGDFNISADTLYPREGVLRPLEMAAGSDDLSGGFDIDLGKGSPDIMTVGFYAPEGWGAWTKVDNPWVLLPRPLAGRVRLRLPVKGFGQNVGREVFLHAGNCVLPLTLTDDLVEHAFEIEIDQPLNFLRLSNIDHSLQASDEDTRTLGIGVEGIKVEQLEGAPADTAAAPASQQLDLNGIVYTSIFNPRDPRKNWEDLLTAFCYAFRWEPRSTLVLKMTCKSATEYLDDLFELLCQLHPFECRVVILHGFLEADEFTALLENSSYIVNASRGEGQCLPLMEFMSSGIPAIAPLNTAMADYITPGCAFVVDSTPEPTFWPHERNQLLTTFWHKPSWESLFDAYVNSFRVGIEQRDEYVAMARVASEQLQQYCSVEVLSQRLRGFLQNLGNG